MSEEPLAGSRSKQSCDFSNDSCPYGVIRDRVTVVCKVCSVRFQYK